LLPIVYDQLRRLAAERLAREAPGQTLQATALVHEAYRRLVGGDPDRVWNGRAHFVASARRNRLLSENFGAFAGEAESTPGEGRASGIG
jgi:hypothetical protein